MRGSFVPILLVLVAFIGAAQFLDDAAERAAQRETVIRLSAEARTWRLDERDALIESPESIDDAEVSSDPLVVQAKAQFASGDRGGAIALLQESLDDSITSLSRRLTLGRMLLTLHRPDEAWVLMQHRTVNEDASALFFRGVLASQQGRLDDAVASYRSAIALRPAHYESNYNLGLVLLDLGSHLQAAKPLRAAVKAGGGKRKAKALFALGAALARADDAKGAEAAYRRAIEFWPDYLLPRVNLALLYGIKRRADAEAILDEAIRLRPDFAPAYFLKARLASKANESDRALRFYDQAARLDPGLYKARYNQGILQLDLGHLGQALATFEALTLSFPARSEPWFNIGRIAYRRDQFEAARKAYETALAAADQDYPEANLNLALVDRAEGKLDPALNRLDKLIEEHPDYVAAYINRGTVRQRKKDFEGAIADFERALELKPKSVSAQYNLARVLAGSGRRDDAIVAYRKVLARDPHHDRAAVNLGIELVAQGDAEAAAKAFATALETQPRSVKANFQLGRLKMKAGENKPAIAYLQAVLKVDDDHVTARRLLGLLYARVGALDEAVEAYEATLERRPDLKSVRFNLALALKKLGDLPAAELEFDRCLRLSPSYAPCLRSVALLALDAQKPQRARALLKGKVSERSPAYLMATHARVLYATGREDEARAWLERAVTKAPEDDEVRSALAEIPQP